MASYSVTRENAKKYFLSERLPLPCPFSEFSVQGPFLINPEGNGINLNILRDFEYWNYSQRCLGFGSEFPPVLPINPVPDSFKHLMVHLDYLISLQESHRSNTGIGFQRVIDL